MNFKYLLTAALMVCAGSALSQEFKIDGINYQVSSPEDKTCTLLLADDNVGGEIVIPSAVTYGDESYTVTKIGEYAFAGNKVTSVEIPSSVTVIANNVFDDCTLLKSAKLPETLTSLGDYAFYNCTKLQEVNFPNSLTEVGKGPFCYCSKLPDPLYNDEFFAFLPVAYEGKYSIPEGIKTVVAYAFDKKVTEVELPNSVTTVQPYAFWNANGLEKPVYNDKIFAALPLRYDQPYAIPEGIETIAGGAFVYCSSLPAITIPESVTTILTDAFCFCASLTEVELSNNVTFVGDYAFSDCYSLTKPVMNDKIFAAVPPGTVGEYIIPDGITTIVGGALQDCLYLTSVVVPESVETIGRAAFMYCQKLENVTLPSSLTAISPGTFAMCSALKQITLPENITTIGYDAFYDCVNLQSLETPNSVTTIEYLAFKGCSSLKSLTLGSAMETIGAAAFIGCTDISEIKSKNLVPPTWDEGAFDGLNKETCKVLVWKDALEDYKNDDQWSEFFNIIGVDDFDGIESAQVADITIAADHGCITVTGTRRGDRIAVYALNGTLLTSATAADGQTVVPCQTSGLVIVKCAGKAQKCRLQ